MSAPDISAAAAAMATACERLGLTPRQGREILARVVALGPARLPALEALDGELRRLDLDLPATLALVQAVREGFDALPTETAESLGDGGRLAAGLAAVPPPASPDTPAALAAPYGPEPARLSASVESLRAEIRRREPA